MLHVIRKDITIESSHSLDRMPEGHKCRNLHGHTYHITVELASPELDNMGMVIDFALISGIVKMYDHQHLNHHFEPTTAEVFAMTIGERIQGEILNDLNEGEPYEKRVRINEVTVCETETSAATWRP